MSYRFSTEILDDREQVLYVFQGFPFDVYEALFRLGIPHLSEKEISEYIDYHLLERKEESVTLLMKLMTSTESAWIFYEEFIAISSMIVDFSIYSGRIIIVHNNLFDNYFPIPVRGQGEDGEILKLYAKEGNEDHPIFKYYSDCKLIDGVMYYAYVNKHFEIDTGIEIKERDFYSESNRNIEEIDIREREICWFHRIRLIIGSLSSVGKQMRAVGLFRHFASEHRNILLLR